MEAEAKKEKKDLYALHIIIMAVIMFGFRLLPPPGTVTPYIYNSSVVGYLINASVYSYVKKTFPEICLRFFLNENNSYNLLNNMGSMRCDIYIITINENALDEFNSIFENYNMQCDILLNDTIVVCFNELSALNSQNENVAFNETNTTNEQDHCILHLSELEEHQNWFYNDSFSSITRLDDIMTTKKLLQTNPNLFVFMPNITYQNYFNKKAFTYKNIPNISLVHAIIYPKECDENTKQLVQVIKNEVKKYGK